MGSSGRRHGHRSAPGRPASHACWTFGSSNPSSPARRRAPSSLLERRPDVRQAEALFHAATARVGAAKGDLFPKLMTAEPLRRRALPRPGAGSAGHGRGHALQGTGRRVAGDTGGLGPATLTPPDRGSKRVQALSHAEPQLGHCDRALFVAHELAIPLARTLELVPVFRNRVHPVADAACLTPNGHQRHCDTSSLSRTQQR
jgi:hypothetical protein